MPTFDTPEAILVVIDMAVADIRINAGDRTDTVVRIRPSDEHDDADVHAAEHAQVDYAHGRLLLRAAGERPASAPGWGLSLGNLGKLVESAEWARQMLLGPTGSVEVTIDLPAGSRLDVRSAAELRCQGPLDEVTCAITYGGIRIEQAGRLRLRATHGDIWVDRSAGHAEVTNTHGAIRIGEIDGTAAVTTSHGDVRLREVTGRLRLRSGHGDSSVERAPAGVAATTAYGSVRIGEAVAGSVVLETTGGTLELGIRAGTAAWLDVSSKHGTVDVALDPGDGPGQAQDVVEVHAHTAYGDIVIHRS